MKLISLLVVFLTLNLSNDLLIIRGLYPQAAKSEQMNNELVTKLTSVTKESDKILVAYKGASLALKAKFANHISDKISNIKEGATLIDFAVACEPTNVEMRLIRLSIQENVPLIVNYRKNIKEDKDYLMAHYQDQTDELKRYMNKFIEQSKSFTDDEKKDIIK